jgi:hypothetical protein
MWLDENNLVKQGKKSKRKGSFFSYSVKVAIFAKLFYMAQAAAHKSNASGLRQA